MAKAMQSGAYTDGGAAGDWSRTSSSPATACGGMTQFMKATQLAGNDEQYASALALAANRLGVPARVVLGADARRDRRGQGQGRPRLGGGPAVGRLVAADLLQAVPARPEQEAGAADPEVRGEEDRRPGPATQRRTTRRASSRVRTRPRTPPSSHPAEGRQEPARPDSWPDWLRYLVFFVAIPLCSCCSSSMAASGWPSGFADADAAARGDRPPRDGRVARGGRHRARPADALPVKGTRLEQARALEVHLSGPPPERPSPIVDGAAHRRPHPGQQGGAHTHHGAYSRRVDRAGT